MRPIPARIEPTKITIPMTQKKHGKGLTPLDVEARKKRAKEKVLDRNEGAAEIFRVLARQVGPKSGGKFGSTADGSIVKIKAKSGLTGQKIGSQISGIGADTANNQAPLVNSKLRRKSHSGFITLNAGETLVEDFIVPLGLNVEQIANAIPPKIYRNYTHEITSFAMGDDESFIDLDLSLAVDRFLGLPSGYFYRLQTACLIRESKIKNADWLDRIIPLKTKDLEASKPRTKPKKMPRSDAQ